MSSRERAAVVRDRDWVLLASGGFGLLLVFVAALTLVLVAQ